MNSYSPVKKPNFRSSNDEIDLSNLAKSIRRSWWIIILFVLLAIVVSDFYLRRIAIKLFPAEAMIVLEESQPQIVSDFEGFISNAPLTKIGINTELQVLRSRELAAKLVDKLDLTNQVKFNQFLSPHSVFTRAKVNILEFFGTESTELKSIPSPEDIRSSAINFVIEAMEFSNIPKTRVISISVITKNAELSVLIANTMAEIYVKNQIQLKLNALSSATKSLSERTSELKNDFEKLKLEFSNLSSQLEFVNSKDLELQEIQLRELRVRLSEARGIMNDEKQTRLNIKLLKESGNLEALITLADDFRLNQANSLYINKEIAFDDLNHEVERFIKDIEKEAYRKQRQLLALKTSEAMLSDQFNLQSQELIILQQLDGETEAARLLYENFHARLLEMNVQHRLVMADGRILSKAIQKGPSFPRNIYIFSLAGLIGSIIGIGIVISREIRFSGYRSVGNLHDETGLKVLASIPLIPKRNRKAIINYLKKKPSSVFSEAVRQLRTSILMSDSGIIPQVIMLTSSVPKEGKTVLTFALAQNMVGLGKRVLLIEADIRRSVHSINIDRKNSVSLVDLLIGNKKLAEVKPFNEHLGFDILTAARSNMNAADLFSSQRFSKLLAELRKNYDFILIDSPPVLAVPDARVIASKSDTNIYIIEWNKTSHDQLEQGLEMLSSVGAQTTGLVLNQIDPNKMKSYGLVNQYDYTSNEGAEYYEN